MAPPRIHEAEPCATTGTDEMLHLLETPASYANKPPVGRHDEYSRGVQARNSTQP